MSSSGETSPSGTPLTPGQPKFGTLIPNRIFVGGIPANTQENELKMFFSNHGAVKDCKIINDRAGVSKGYGFVTFETQEDADKVIKKEADNLIFKERKLNIGPAIRKQQAFPRMEPPPGVYFTNGSLTPYSYQNGMAVFHEYPISAAQPQPATYPVMAAAQQTMYAMPQGYAAVQTSPPAATPASWATAATAANQFRWAPQSPGSAVGPYMYSPLQTAEMFAYTQPTATMYATDMSEVEAAAAAAEGSMALEPNMARHQYVSESQITTPQVQPQPSYQQYQPQYQQQYLSPTQQQQHQQTQVVTQKTGPIVYGKRPGSALVSPPSKFFGTPQSSVTYSPMATPVQIKGVPRVVTKTVNGTPINVLIKDNKIRPIDVSCNIPLTPPPTPEVSHTH